MASRMTFSMEDLRRAGQKRAAQGSSGRDKKKAKSGPSRAPSPPVVVKIEEEEEERSLAMQPVPTGAPCSGALVVAAPAPVASLPPPSVVVKIEEEEEEKGPAVAQTRPPSPKWRVPWGQAPSGALRPPEGTTPEVLPPPGGSRVAEEERPERSGTAGPGSSVFHDFGLAERLFEQVLLPGDKEERGKRPVDDILADFFPQLMGLVHDAFLIKKAWRETVEQADSSSNQARISEARATSLEEKLEAARARVEKLEGELQASHSATDDLDSELDEVKAEVKEKGR